MFQSRRSNHSSLVTKEIVSETDEFNTRMSQCCCPFLWNEKLPSMHDFLLFSFLFFSCYIYKINIKARKNSFARTHHLRATTNNLEMRPHYYSANWIAATKKFNKLKRIGFFIQITLNGFCRAFANWQSIISK